MPTTRFEKSRMRDDDAFDVFYASLHNMLNSSFNLGGRILEPKIVRKIFRSLPEWFRHKITVIEKYKDIDSIKVEELVVIIQTYELTLAKPIKEKFLAFNTMKNNWNESSDSDSPNEEKLIYLVKKFQKMFRNKNTLQKRYRGVPSKSKRISKSVKCHKCHFFGHMSSECPTNSRNHDKAIIATLTDDESSSDSQSEKSTPKGRGKYIAFTARTKSGSD